MNIRHFDLGSNPVTVACDCHHSSGRDRMSEASRRFRFSDVCDLVLVRIVAQADAHLACYRGVDKKWVRVLEIFMESHEVIAHVHSRGCDTPKERTLHTRFNKLVAKRRGLVREL